MTTYESFLKRYDAINLIDDTEQQLDEFALLDNDIYDWINKKYPELSSHYCYMPEEISDMLIDSEKDFIKEIIKNGMTTSDLNMLLNVNTEELLNNYIKSKN